MVKLKIFNNEEPSQPFIDDLNVLVRLPEEKIKKILSILLDLDYITQYRYRAKRKELSKELDMDEDAVLSAFNVSIFITGSFFSGVSKKDLIEDLKKIVHKPDYVTRLKSILRYIDNPDVKERFEITVDSSMEILKGLPSVGSLFYTINKRAVIRDGKLVREIPMIILRLETIYEDKKEYITIQQTTEQLQDLIDGLKEATGNMKKLK